MLRKSAITYMYVKKFNFSMHVNRKRLHFSEDKFQSSLFFIADPLIWIIENRFIHEEYWKIYNRSFIGKFAKRHKKKRLSMETWQVLRFCLSNWFSIFYSFWGTFQWGYDAMHVSRKIRIDPSKQASFARKARLAPNLKSASFTESKFELLFKSRYNVQKQMK